MTASKVTNPDRISTVKLLRGSTPNHALNRTRRFMTSTWRAASRRAGYLDRWTSQTTGAASHSQLGVA